MNRRPKAKAARRSQGLSRTALARAALAPPLRAAAAVADWAHAFGAGAIDLATLNVDETHHLPQRGSDQERPEIRTEQKARPQLQAPEDRRRYRAVEPAQIGQKRHLSYSIQRPASGHSLIHGEQRVNSAQWASRNRSIIYGSRPVSAEVMCDRQSRLCVIIAP